MFKSPLGQTCNYPNVYAKNLEHVEYFVGTHTHCQLQSVSVSYFFSISGLHFSRCFSPLTCSPQALAPCAVRYMGLDWLSNGVSISEARLANCKAALLV